jgi:hypothetical protein
MRDMQCAIPRLAECQPMPQWSFKALLGLSQAVEWISKHPQYECRLRQSIYSKRDSRYIVNYRKLPVS